ncbi:hypothetical protein ACOSQ3_031032 [Xanthoceras sorbifolium]
MDKRVAKKLAKVLLTMTTLVAAFTFNAALTIPAYKGPNRSVLLKFCHRKYDEIGFMIFIVTTAVSSASCLSAAATICWLFWLAFVFGLYVVLSNNETIPTGFVCAFVTLYFVTVVICIWNKLIVSPTAQPGAATTTTVPTTNGAGGAGTAGGSGIGGAGTGSAGTGSANTDSTGTDIGTD